MSGEPPLLADGRRRGLAVVVGWAVAQGAAAAAAAMALRAVFGALHGGSAVPAAAVAGLALAGLALAGARVAERAAAEALGWDYAAAVRARLLAHLSRQSARGLARQRAGALSLRFVGDLGAARRWASRGLARLIAAGVVAPMALAALGWWDWRLALAAGLPMLAGVGVMALLAQRLGPAQRRLRSVRGRMAIDMAERAPMAAELRLVGRMAQEGEVMARHAGALRQAGVDHARAAAAVRAVADASWGVSAAALVTVTVLADVAAADLAMALALSGLLLRPMRDLAGVADAWRGWSVARGRLREILRQPRLPRPRVDRPADRPRGPMALRFEALAGAGLRAVDAEAPPGARVALIGAAGAGKSALIALAAGMDAPETGAALLDGAPALALGAVARARAIVYVGPRAPILRGSLRRALTLGLSRRPDDAAVAAAAKRFGLGPAILRLGGLDGRVEEGGRNLSDGERRAVALARAALARPRLMLLDEPTAGLSAAVRAEVLALIAATPATVLVATHDADVAEIMDSLWLLDAGALAQTGAPAAMLAGDGPAARLLRPRPAA